MRVALIGHRGVGKSSLLKRLQTYYGAANAKVECIDLDREITEKAGRPIEDVFAHEGEAAFRELERSTFESIDSAAAFSKHDIYCAIGAGFDPKLIPEHWHVIWVRRATDAAGRVFLDRPRLNARVSPIEEYQERFRERQEKYRARADEVLWLDEGLEGPDLAERDYFFDAFNALGGAVTLLPKHLRSTKGMEEWIRSRVRWGVQWFELRDDLLSEEQMDVALQLLPDERILMSFRTPEKIDRTARLVTRQRLSFDWPVELGRCSFAQPRFLSLHRREPGASIADTLRALPVELPTGTQLKAALPVADFTELLEGHTWREKYPQGRVFLPMSIDGRWAWYRLLMGSASPLNFFREGDGTSPDQPTLLQWARMRAAEEERAAKRAAPGFAAVLGDPVAHSRTPTEHRDFFSQSGSPVVAVRVSRDEWKQGALRVLHGIGLRWAAVTAPLKDLAFASCGRMTSEAQELRSVNTLVWDASQKEWAGTNTDLEGFAKAVHTAAGDRQLEPVAVWGGGGTLAVIKKILPGAQLFSARTGDNRDERGAHANGFHPKTVVWAAGSQQGAESGPHESWRPEVVIDLNYAESSAGRTYALASGAKYFSGLVMFKAQAAAQRRFWGKK